MKKNIIISTLLVLLVIFVLQYIQARHMQLFLECMRDGGIEYTDQNCHDEWVYTSIWSIPVEYIPFIHY